MEDNFTLVNEVNRIIERLDSLCDKPILRFEDQRKIKQGTEEGLVSIILPVGKDSKNFKTCIQNIRRHTAVPYEIIFAVNPSNQQKIRQYLKHKSYEKIDFQTVLCSENLGLAEACNEGIKDSRGEYIVLLTPNAIVTKNWVSGMLECLKSVAESGVVGPLSNLFGGTEQFIETTLVSSQKAQHMADNLWKNFRHRRISTHSINSGCMLFTRELFKMVGGFDANFRFEAGFQEDFCFRVALEGKTNLIAGDVYIYEQKTRPLPLSRRYFKRKWENPDPETQLGKKLLTLTAVEKGVEAYQKEDFDAAIKLLIEGIQRSPFDPLPYFELAERSFYIAII